MNLELTGALSGLRRLDLCDLQTYKNALSQTNRLCWQQYFPFLYFLYVVNSRDELFIYEEDGSICIFLKLNYADAKPELCLYFLPIPMNKRVLQACFERIRTFNNGKRAVVYWVDEEEMGTLGNLDGSVRTFTEEREYIYDPKIYRNLSGMKVRDLQRNLNKILSRTDLEVRDFVEGDIEECLALMNDWAAIKQEKNERASPRSYARKCVRFSSHFDKKDLFGRVVLVDGKIRSLGFAGEIRPGLANLFVVYSDNNIKGLDRFQNYQMMLALEEYDLVNSAYAETPGLKYAKESFLPVSTHGMYRIQVFK